MKIILSPAKTISKTCERFKEGDNFTPKTKEIISRIPEILQSKEYMQAFWMYDGMCYKNISREQLTNSDLEYINTHLIIISALYGALRPFNLVLPYRLDFNMKTKMGNLYQFWQGEIAKEFADELILNLASDEFAKTIRPYVPAEKIVDLEFFEQNGSILKKHSTISKKARGLMLNFMAQNKVININNLKGFNQKGYAYAGELSSPNKLVFVRQVIDNA